MEGVCVKVTGKRRCWPPEVILLTISSQCIPKATSDQYQRLKTAVISRTTDSGDTASAGGRGLDSNPGQDATLPSSMSLCRPS